MPRYYFDLQDGVVPTSDEEGLDLPDAAAAREHAAFFARDVAASALQEGRLRLGVAVEVRDEHGYRLAQVKLADVVDVDR